MMIYFFLRHKNEGRAEGFTPTTRPGRELMCGRVDYTARKAKAAPWSCSGPRRGLGEKDVIYC
jgi:hypothetical protein